MHLMTAGDDLSVDDLDGRYVSVDDLSDLYDLLDNRLRDACCYILLNCCTSGEVGTILSEYEYPKHAFHF